MARPRLRRGGSAAGRGRAADRRAHLRRPHRRREEPDASVVLRQHRHLRNRGVPRTVAADDRRRDRDAADDVLQFRQAARHRRATDSRSGGAGQVALREPPRQDAAEPGRPDAAAALGDGRSLPRAAPAAGAAPRPTGSACCSIRGSPSDDLGQAAREPLQQFARCDIDRRSEEQRDAVPGMAGLSHRGPVAGDACALCRHRRAHRSGC